MSQHPLRIGSPAPEPQQLDAAPLDRFVSIDQVAASPTPWLLPGRMIQGAITILEGDPNCGKSSWLSELAAALSVGRSWLGYGGARPRKTLWLTSEEDAGSAIRPRLARAGADQRHIIVDSAAGVGMQQRITLPGSVRFLGEAVEALGLSLIILDPLISFIGADTDLNHEGQARAIVDPAAEMCRQTGCCLVLVRQLKKDRSGPRITHGLGSMAVAAAARTILQIDRPDAHLPRRVLRAVKCSGGPAAPPLQYSLLIGEGAPVMASVRELAESEDDAGGDLVDAGDRQVRADARALLQTLLRGVWVKAQTCLAMAECAGIGSRTLWKVKAELACASRRVGGGEGSYSEWGPPGSDAGGGTPVQSTPECRVPQKKPRKQRGKG